MITFIKWCLEQRYERLRYPETYSKKQIESVEEILKFFKDVSLGITGEKALEIRLGNDKNTVIAMPLEGGHMIAVSNIPETHKTKWGEDSLAIEPKRKFRKTFPYTLIIRRVFKTLNNKNP